VPAAHVELDQDQAVKDEQAEPPPRLGRDIADVDQAWCEMKRAGREMLTGPLERLLGALAKLLVEPD
jgi:hypothetical protein